MDKNKKIRGQLVAAYNTLSSFEQALLKLLSVIYEPVKRSTIVNCLRRAGIKGPDEKSWATLHALAPYLKGLQKLKLLDDHYQCHEAIVEVLARQALAAGCYADLVRAAREELPLSNGYDKRSQRCWRAMREYRIALYGRDLVAVEDIMPLIAQNCDGTGRQYPAMPVCANPFQAEWLCTLPSSLQFHVLDQLLACSLQRLEDFAPTVEYLQAIERGNHITADERLPFLRLLAGHFLWRGQLTDARHLVERNPASFAASGFEGCLYFLQGDHQQAICSFEADLQRLVELTGKRHVYFYNLAGLFYLVALLKNATPAQFPQIKKYIHRARARQADQMLAQAYTLLEAILLTRENEITEMDAVINAVPRDHGVVALFAALALFWLYGELPGEIVKELLALYERARHNGFHWLAMEYAALLAQADKSFLDSAASGEEYGNRAAALKREHGLASVVAMLMPEKSWERKLKALINMGANPRNTGIPADDKWRLVWWVGHQDGQVSISPREQKITAGQAWSKGRPVALNRLYAGRNLAFLTAQDRRICGAIRRRQDNKGISYYSFDIDTALVNMVGHPLLFLEDSPGVPVEFVKGEPELLVEETRNWLRVGFSQEIMDEGVTVLRETPTRFRVVSINNDHRLLVKIIGKEGLRVPHAARNQLMTAIANISSVITVHSAVATDAAGRQAADIEQVPADTGIHIHLMPLGSGFRLEMFVKPFANDGPYLKPGEGVVHVIAEIGGRRLQTRRNLELEEEKARQVETACPTLLAHKGRGREWLLQETEDCLQVLLELQAIKDQVAVEWPEGEKLSVSGQASFNQLTARIRTKRDWFEVSGQLEVDRHLLLDMQKLLELAAKNTGRFIPLGDGQFLALTDEFRKRLATLNSCSERWGHKAGGRDQGGAAVRIHPLAALALDDFSKGLAGLEADEGWLARIGRIKEARQLAVEVPAAMRAELRDYQVEGFRWLMRLAHWGVGCCLADDMGLGKTLQALAAILYRAPQGPSLVVAPTSVCMNWQSEASRFTPTLRVTIFNGRGRKERVKAMGPMDVLVVSYTLLQQQEKLLAGVDWQTIVLDEAQAIKNLATKRSRAAMALEGRFKFITTGTPIENHLGELWNLFNFINPGLLGSLASFNERFAVPIEKHQDVEVRERLKKLIRPFMLRRVKSEVLAELPPRTEILLWVEMSHEERAFYEALRRQALGRLESNTAPPGYNMQILAEIMRLRRACCNARLVVPHSTIASAKLELFGKVAGELLENQHKCLVFSQFVQHLAIIREFLDKQGIDYRYLDGSTSLRERHRQVKAFQAGEGGLFLISLKAGGLGLNLTAADYVIHMDPWWNPAVEDQASDRAHRIGQKLPVTIYRLVTKNTIEEKIVNLHQQKRELANSLLAGSDLSVRISADELLNLIREG